MQIDNKIYASSMPSLRIMFWPLLLLLSISLLFFESIIQIDTLLFSIVATLLYCIMCLYFLKTNFSFSVISFLFLFSQFTAICSNVIIESGAYMVEINRYGYITGATARLVFLNILFFYSVYIIYNKSFANIRYKFIDFSKILVPAIHFITIIYYIICGYVLLHYGSPLIEHMDRFLYHKTLPHIVFLISNLFLTLSFLQGIVAVYYLKTRNRRKIIYCFVNLIFLIMYRILFGDKWSGLFFCYVLFYMPILVWVYHNMFENLRRFFIVCLITFLSLFVISSKLTAFYYNTERGNSQVVPKIESRFVDQGQVWWGIDESMLQSSKNYPLNSLNRDEQMGLYRLMRTFVDNGIVDRYKSNGVTFTMGFPAIFLYEYGYLGTGLLLIICGMFVGYLVNWMITAILNCDIVLSLLLIRVYLMLLNGFMMGDIYRFGDWKFLVTVLLLIMYILILFSCKSLRTIES